MAIALLTDIKPCPFGCDQSQLSVGRQSAMTQGICCLDCGCTMERRLLTTYPFEWEVPGIDSAEDLFVHGLNQIIERWNDRPGSDRVNHDILDDIADKLDEAPEMKARRTGQCVEFWDETNDQWYEAVVRLIDGPSSK